MEKLLLLAGIGRGLYAKWQMHRLLSGLITIAILVVLTSSMISAIVIGGFFAAYHFLVISGVSPAVAAATLCTAALLITLIFILSIRIRLAKLLQRHVPQSPIVDKANTAVNSFFEGFYADEAA